MPFAVGERESVNSNLLPILRKTLLSYFVRDREQILADEKKSPVLSDLKPGLEYYFFDTPDKRPIWPKSDLRETFIPRIQGCDAQCQQEIYDLSKPKR